MTFLTTHWATILVILAVLHTTASTILGALNKPAAETTLENVWHYVQILSGFGTKLATSQDPAVAPAVAALSGDAATLAKGS